MWKDNETSKEFWKKWEFVSSKINEIKEKK